MSHFQLSDAFSRGEFVITAELGPPKGCDSDALNHHIDILKDRVHAVNVTDNQSAVMRASSLGVCAIVLQRGGEPILQLTCRDRNRLALQSDLLAANILGIHNVVCLTGDHPASGDHPDARGVFDFDSVHLIQAVRCIENGRDFGGNELSSPGSFCCGGVVTPEADPIEPQLMKFRKKALAGMEFAQTQAVFDLGRFENFMAKVRATTPDVKILAGILLLSSPGMARYVQNNIPGIRIPDALLQRLTDSPKGTRLETGIDIAAETIRRLKESSLCDGVHIMAINKEEQVPHIMERAGL